MTIKGIIFDCDGVLVNSEKLSIKALLTLARPYGFKSSIAEAMQLFHGKSYQFCFETIRNGSKKKLPENFEADYRAMSFDLFKRELTPVKGIVSFINSLKIPFCVASSGPRDKILLNLQLIGLADKFENAIFSCYDIQKWKPEPDIFLHAAKEMKFSINECIVVEDSPTGVEAAIRGGFKVFGYANKGTALELENAGAEVFYNFRDLYRLIQFH